jgi:hypothetical protein
MSRARYPSGKGEVCKTFMRRFDSDPRLQSFLAVACLAVRLKLSFRVDWGGWPRLLNRLLITQPGVGPNTALLQFVFYPAAFSTSLCRCSTRCRRSRCSRSGVHRRGKRPSTTVSHGVVHVARGAIVIVGIARHRFRGQPVQRIVAIIHSAAAQLRHGQAISRRAQRIRVVRQRARIFRRANLRQPVQRVVAVGVRHPVRIREVLQISHRIVSICSRPKCIGYRAQPIQLVVGIRIRSSPAIRRLQS